MRGHGAACKNETHLHASLHGVAQPTLICGARLLTVTIYTITTLFETIFLFALACVILNGKKKKEKKNETHNLHNRWILTACSNIHRLWFKVHRITTRTFLHCSNFTAFNQRKQRTLNCSSAILNSLFTVN